MGDGASEGCRAQTLWLDVSRCSTLYFSVFSVLGSDFLKYMEAFKPFLVIGLKNYAEYQVSVARHCAVLTIVPPAAMSLCRSGF